MELMLSGWAEGGRPAVCYLLGLLVSLTPFYLFFFCSRWRVNEQPTLWSTFGLEAVERKEAKSATSSFISDRWSLMTLAEESMSWDDATPPTAETWSVKVKVGPVCWGGRGETE